MTNQDAGKKEGTERIKLPENINTRQENGT